MNSQELKKVWERIVGVCLANGFILLIKSIAFWLFYNLSIGWVTGVWINPIQVIAFVCLLSLVVWTIKS